MRGDSRVGVGLVGLLLLAIGLALFASPRPVAADEESETGEPVGIVTTELQPGWNLAGWTELATDVETIFETLPDLEVLYSWDADYQRFRLAARTESGVFGDLRRLTPGMGLWLFLTGDETAPWTRPIIAEAAYASLREGWNLVVWGGEDGIASRTALQDIDDILTTAFDVNGRWPLRLATGEAYWLDLSGAREWSQVYQPPEIEFLVDFPQRQRDEVRAHIDDVVAFYFQRLGFRVPGVTVRYGDPELFGCSGHYVTPVVTMADCLDIFAHEYVHAIQEHLTGGGRHPPLWLREGDANFWAAVYKDAKGEGDYAETLRELVLPVARSEGFESRGFTYHSYHIRVHVLVKREGTEKLVEFYRQTARLGDWQLAFEETYGMTFDEFNVVFAQEMLVAPDPSDGCPVSWFEPEKTPERQEVCAKIEGRVTDLAGNPRVGVDVRAYPDGSTRFGDPSAATGESSADGSFSLNVPPGAYKLALRPPTATDRFVLYHEDRTIETSIGHADVIRAVGSDPATIEIAYGVLSGVVLTDEGQPVPGLRAALHQGLHIRYKREGAFTYIVGRGTFTLEFHCNFRTVGWYDGETGLVQGKSRAAPIVMEDADRTDISITVPPSIRCE